MFHRDAVLRACALVLLTSSAGSTAVFAQELSIDSSIRTVTTFDNNVVLSPDDSEIVSFFQRTTPSVTVSINDETWRASVDLDLAFVDFEDEGFSSDDQNLTLSLSKFTETVVWQFQASNRRSNTRDTELEDVGGLLLETNRRDVQNFRPVVQWTFSPKNQLVAGVSAENTHYDGFEFRDYDYYGADAAWNHQYSEKLRLDVSLFANEFESVSPLEGQRLPPGCSVDIDRMDIADPSDDVIVRSSEFSVSEGFGSDTIGATVGLRSQTSERLSYNASFGYRQVDSVSNGRQCFVPRNSFFNTSLTQPFEVSSESSGLVLNSGLDYVGEKYSLSLSLSRSVSPVGIGLLSEQDIVSVRGEYKFNPTLSASLIARYQNSEAVDDASLFSRRSFRLGPRLVWRFNEKLTLQSGANYREVKGQQSAARDGLQVFVGAMYRFESRKRKF